MQSFLASLSTIGYYGAKLWTPPFVENCGKNNHKEEGPMDHGWKVAAA